MAFGAFVESLCREPLSKLEGIGGFSTKDCDKGHPQSLNNVIANAPSPALATMRYPDCRIKFACRDFGPVWFAHLSICGFRRGRLRMKPYSNRNDSLPGSCGVPSSSY